MAKQQTAGGNVIGTFVALETFSCDELKSQYVKGHRYNIREGNEVLPPLLDNWLAENKVRLG